MLAALEAAGVIEARVGGQAAGVRVHGFKSALVADVAYRTIAPSIRQALHRRIAEHLEQKPGASAEEIALHYDRAGLPEVAARAYARAALEAAAHGDGERVLRCSQAALSQELEPSVRFALHAARADTLGFMGRPAEQAQELERALSAACAPAERARALSDQAWLRAREGALAEALEIGRRAVAEADAGEDASMRALARSRLAYAHMQAGAAAAAIEHVSEAWAAAEDTPPQVRALVAAMGAFVASSSGDLGATPDPLRDRGGPLRGGRGRPPRRRQRGQPRGLLQPHRGARGGGARAARCARRLSACGKPRGGGLRPAQPRVRDRGARPSQRGARAARRRRAARGRGS
ncbi:MAG: hypothetical protein M5U28_21950 [Sandaracinaceae bacterium]|nr:hypothetical protein [Sandaracinaceae bacterium]